MGEIASVDDEIGWAAEVVDCLDRTSERPRDVRIRPAGESDVAVADLGEPQCRALIPGMPGVVLTAEPKSIDGRDVVAVAGGEEQATAGSTIAGAANLCVCLDKSVHLRDQLPHRYGGGLPDQAGWSGCGANTSITPFASRTSNAGNGFGAIGS